MSETSIKVEPGLTPPTKEQIENAAVTVIMSDNKIRLSEDLIKELLDLYPGKTVKEALVQHTKDHPPRRN